MEYYGFSAETAFRFCFAARPEPMPSGAHRGTVFRHTGRRLTSAVIEASFHPSTFPPQSMHADAREGVHRGEGGFFIIISAKKR